MGDSGNIPVSLFQDTDMFMTCDNHIHLAAKIIGMVREAEGVTGDDAVLRQEIDTDDAKGLTAFHKNQIFRLLLEAEFIAKTDENPALFPYRATWKGLQFTAYYKYVRQNTVDPLDGSLTKEAQLLFLFQ